MRPKFPCPLLALNGRFGRAHGCLLIGVEQTRCRYVVTSESDPGHSAFHVVSTTEADILLSSFFNFSDGELPAYPIRFELDFVAGLDALENRGVLGTEHHGVTVV